MYPSIAEIAKDIAARSSMINGLIFISSPADMHNMMAHIPNCLLTFRLALDSLSIFQSIEQYYFLPLLSIASARVLIHCAALDSGYLNTRGCWANMASGTAVSVRIYPIK